MKHKKFISVIFIVLTAVILLFPFTESCSKLNFAINYNDRLSVIEYIKNNPKTNEYDDIGDFTMVDIDKYKLPYMYKHLSLGGNVKVVYQDDAITVDFLLYRFIDKGVHIVYSSNDVFSADVLKYTNEDVLNITSPKNNWFIVKADEI